MAEERPDAPALLVFADDWGRHPSSCQHLIRHLSARHPVWWVNTIGTRRPRLDLATLRRGFEKLGQWLRPARPAVASAVTNPTVLNPRMWPWMSSRLSRWLNRKLLARQLVPVLQSAGRPVTAITTIPLVADLMDVLPVARWVYYCVDDFSLWPGLDHTPLRAMEETLIRRADVLIAASETLRDKLAQGGREVHLLTHGVDPDAWRVNGQPHGIPELDRLRRPLVVFWGLVDRRLDVGFVRQLAHDLDDGTIVLVGPEAEPDPALLTLPRVARIPALPVEQLAYVAREAAVLVMPYDDLPVTRAMQPLKLKEYLATGKPAVVRDLPATRPWADCLDLADSPAVFSQTVRRRLAGGLCAEQEQARGRLRGETWAEKARLFEQWVIGS